MCAYLTTLRSSYSTVGLCVWWIYDNHINPNVLLQIHCIQKKICLRHLNNEWSLLPEPLPWVKGWCMGAQRGHTGCISLAQVCTNMNWVMVENVDTLWHLTQRENRALAFQPLSAADRVNSYRDKRASTGEEHRKEHLAWDNFLLNFGQAVKCFCNHSSAFLCIEFLLHCACFA